MYKMTTVVWLSTTENMKHSTFTSKTHVRKLPKPNPDPDSIGLHTASQLMGQWRHSEWQTVCGPINIYIWSISGDSSVFQGWNCSFLGKKTCVKNKNNNQLAFKNIRSHFMAFSDDQLTQDSIRRPCLKSVGGQELRGSFVCLRRPFTSQNSILQLLTAQALKYVVTFERVLLKGKSLHFIPVWER